MNFKEYQKQVKKTAVYKGVGGLKYVYPLMGLCGETGEVAEKFKKVFRDNNGRINKEIKEDIVKELGDVLWYITELGSVIGVDLETIAKKNVEKLLSRLKRNKIKGSGDNR